MKLRKLKDFMQGLSKQRVTVGDVSNTAKVLLVVSFIVIGIKLIYTNETQFQPCEPINVNTEITMNSEEVHEDTIIIIEDLEVPLASWVDNTKESNSILEDIVDEYPVNEIEDIIPIDEVLGPVYEMDYVEPYKMFTNSGLNLRVGPGTEYEVVTSVSINTELEVIGTSGSWSLVNYNGTEYFCNSSYLSSEKTEIVVVQSSPYDNIIVSEDGVSEDVVQYANSYWNKYVPNSVKQFLVENDWKVVVSAKSLKDRFGYSYSVAGVTEGLSNTIFLDNRKNAVDSALLHEIGHALDFSFGYPCDGSYCDEFKELYSVEKDSFVDVTGSPDYARSNPHEYFASVFSNIILSPTKCRQQCPQTVAYIENYIP